MEDGIVQEEIQEEDQRSRLAEVAASPLVGNREVASQACLEVLPLEAAAESMALVYQPLWVARHLEVQRIPCLFQQAYLVLDLQTSNERVRKVLTKTDQLTWTWGP